MRMTEQRSYVVFATGLAIGGLVATLLARKQVRDLLRERGRHGVEIARERASRLRSAAEDLAKRTRELVGSQRDPVKNDTEAERQAYQEEKRDILGG